MNSNISEEQRAVLDTIADYDWSITRPDGSVQTEDADSVPRRVIEAVRQAFPYAEAAELAGVSQSVVLGWRLRGETYEAALRAGEEADPEEERYLKFVKNLRRAEAEGIFFLHNKVRQASYQDIEGDAKHAEWLLARRRPDLYSEKVIQEHQGKGGGPIMVQPVQPLDSELKDAFIEAGVLEEVSDAEVIEE